jgi:hypothetical protein
MMRGDVMHGERRGDQPERAAGLHEERRELFA